MIRIEIYKVIILQFSFMSRILTTNFSPNTPKLNVTFSYIYIFKVR